MALKRSGETYPLAQRWSEDLLRRAEGKEGEGALSLHKRIALHDLISVVSVHQMWTHLTGISVGSFLFWMMKGCGGRIAEIQERILYFRVLDNSDVSEFDLDQI